MAPTIATLPSATTDQSGSLRDSEKRIWMIVIPLSICVPCLIACVVYIVRRYRMNKAKKARPTSQGVPIEVHHRAWLEHMRNISQQNQENDVAPHEINEAMKDVHMHDFAHHVRSQSTPPMPPTHCKPPRSDSPLRHEWHRSEGISDKDVFEFPPPQELHPAVRRDSTQ
ncbi:hypothetical protein NLG97_g8142 [Lecanicillium saksenae]|uniref:Uncharacterized protein n=1 Tax=Lecanicillium saksenae TaxID=468837 RepID=A0ACC1QL53_9HYPO|nr:hypothetical protein NLG97_g8142 [Lecanicillium saksenae]